MLTPVPITFGASGAAHAAGLVPDPGSSAGTTRFLREDATWAAPASGLTVGSAVASGTNSRVLYQDGSGNLAESTNLQFNGTSLNIGANPVLLAGTCSFAQSGNGLVFTNTTNDLFDFVFNTSASGTNLRYENRPSQLMDSGLPEVQIGSITTPAIRANRNRTRMGSFSGTVTPLTVNTAAVHTAPAIALSSPSSTTSERNCGYIDSGFNTNTDASYSGDLWLSAGDFTSSFLGKREGVRVRSDGTQALLGFFGHTPAAKQATPVTLADVIALLQAYGLAT